MYSSIKIKGFTLIELVIVIVVLAIISLFSTRFLGWGAQHYVDVTERQQVLDDSRFIVERLTREFKQAIPYSIRVLNSASFSCIEFIPIKTSGRYLSIPISESKNYLSVVAPSSSFIEAGNIITIYPTSPAKVYDSTQQQSFLIDSVDSVVDDSQLVYFTSNISFAAGSPAKRYYIWSNPVSFCLEDQKIYRYQNYATSVNQLTPTQLKTQLGVNYALMAQNVNNQLPEEQPFRIGTADLVRHAQVALYLKFSRLTANSDNMFMYHLVQVPNAP
ncbi:prepilin-type N-terminal cleavage/methylation domain-containing protein [Catenovulum sp. 2E275]|uniref:prepilin-type N-terminal cleavage/methylation domain-containing protein n=1 Tax=Catenovulum sp. 2E275 TaxID=2980497 RepID=UPI0021D22A8D|nr:prepilin-type N-terminal cleavage/methylation domain-containing protein [Catenovulum sp. 2E275]MCU4675065.1 prepilin-type N-terminal cleavage/methylation domain-containing protein [Catenovulum sp. 2E275]